MYSALCSLPACPPAGPLDWWAGQMEKPVSSHAKFQKNTRWIALLISAPFILKPLAVK